MKKRVLLCSAFAVVYAVFLSFGIECLLCVLSEFFSLPDSSAAAGSYSRTLLLCIVLGILCTAVLIGLFILNLKIYEKPEFTKRLWVAQMISAAVISIPMIKLWEALFGILYRTL